MVRKKSVRLLWINYVGPMVLNVQIAAIQKQEFNYYFRHIAYLSIINER
jgi:hypothetical protein